jgi:hypothetical protein
MCLACSSTIGGALADPPHFRIIPLTLSIIVIICLCGVFCFGPLSLYLTWLGAVNRRNRPTVMAGTWDFVALIAGLSGFLIFGGGMLLALLQSSIRALFSGNFAAFHLAWEAEHLAWMVIALVYFLSVAGLVFFSLRSRIHSLSVYNMNRDQMELVIETTLAEMGLSATRFGNVWAQDHGIVSLDTFPGFRHATVRFLVSDERLREELERALRLRLSTVFMMPNPIAVWITSASMFCLFFALACVGLLWFIFFAG